MRHIDVRITVDEQKVDGVRQFKPIAIDPGSCNMSAEELRTLVKYCESFGDDDLGLALIGAFVRSAYETDAE